MRTAAGAVDAPCTAPRGSASKAFTGRPRRSAIAAAISGAVVYVCGDGSRMEPDVRRALSDIAREHGQDSAAWMDRMIADQRYVLDVWAGS